MTFVDMAIGMFGEHLPTETLANASAAMEEGYIDALRHMSYRMNGVLYVGFGSNARPLNQVIDTVRIRGGPL